MVRLKLIALNRGSIAGALISVLIGSLALGGCRKPNADTGSPVTPVNGAAASAHRDATRLWPDLHAQVAEDLEPCDRAFASFHLIDLAAGRDLAEAGSGLTAACEGATARLQDLKEPIPVGGRGSEGVHSWLVALRQSTDLRARIGGVATRWSTTPLTGDEQTLKEMISEEHRGAAVADELLADAVKAVSGTSAADNEPVDRADLLAQSRKAYTAFVQARRPCGRAARDVEETLAANHSDHNVTLMLQAEAAQNTCREVMAKFSMLPGPVGSSVLEDHFAAGVDDCMRSTTVINEAMANVAAAAANGELLVRSDELEEGMREARQVAAACSKGLQNVVREVSPARPRT